MSVTIVPISLGIVQAFALIGSRVALVDTGPPGSHLAIRQEFERRGIRPSDISLIVITHGHLDHSGSVGELQASTGALVAIHPDDALALRTGASLELHPLGIRGRIMARLLKLRPIGPATPYDPDILLADGLSLAPYGIDATILHTPGHTAGSISLLLPSGEAIVGDLITGPGLLGGAGLPDFAENLDRLAASLAHLEDLGVTRLYPSHGRPVEASAIAGLLRRMAKPK
jgi:glyoxylase-like metal-dependent hydrolase (beta-lactamase superfamily II)